MQKFISNTNSVKNSSSNSSIHSFPTTCLEEKLTNQYKKQSESDMSKDKKPVLNPLSGAYLSSKEKDFSISSALEKPEPKETLFPRKFGIFK